MGGYGSPTASCGRSGPAVARGVFGAGSGFRVGWRAVAGGGLVSVFRGFSTSVGGAFILAVGGGGGLGAGLSFYGV